MLVAGASVAVPSATVLANHCPDQPGLDDDWCHTPPTATPRPATPRPTQPPTQPPTQAPATPRPATPRPKPKPKPATAATAEPVDVLPAEVSPTPLEPSFTPEIVVEDPVPTEKPERSSNVAARRSSSATNPAGIVFFLVGLVIGGIAGRMSWGLRRRNKGKIFG